MGKMLRRYWLPALLSAELEADGAPQARAFAGREPGRVPRHRRPRRAPRRELSASRRFARARAQRAVRVALPLPRLEDGRRRAASSRRRPSREEHNSKTRSRAPATPCAKPAGSCGCTSGRGPNRRVPRSRIHALPARTPRLQERASALNWAQVIEGVIDSRHSSIPALNAARQPENAGEDGGRVQADRSSSGLERRRAAHRGAETAYGSAIGDPQAARRSRKNRYIRITCSAAPCFAMFPAADRAGVSSRRSCRWTTRTRGSPRHDIKREEPFTGGAANRPRPAVGDCSRVSTSRCRARSTRSRRASNQRACKIEMKWIRCGRQLMSGSTASTSRISRCRRAWARSTTAARNTSGRATSP